jgi:hypothetical protein
LTQLSKHPLMVMIRSDVVAAVLIAVLLIIAFAV